MTHRKEANKKQTILIVDSDVSHAKLVRECLVDGNFDVTEVRSGPEATAKLSRNTYELVVVETLVLGEKALDFIRQASESVPIIVINKKKSQIDKIAMLENGADDYLSRPFDPYELSARARAVLRRTKDRVSEKPRHLYFDGWTLDTVGQRLLAKNGQPVELTTGEFQLLQFLASNPGRVFDRKQLLNNLSGDNIDPYERSVDMRIVRLRKKLSDETNSGTIIKTVRGAGYTFVAVVSGTKNG